jgi:hypothetical protein
MGVYLSKVVSNLLDFFIRKQIVIADLREMKEKLVLYTDIPEIQRRLTRLKLYLYKVSYYNTNNGKILGVDLYFDKSAKHMLSRVANTYQLPFF